MHWVVRALGWFYSTTGVLRPRRTTDRVVIGTPDAGDGTAGQLSVAVPSSESTAIATQGTINTSGVVLHSAPRAWVVLPEVGSNPTTSHLTAGCGVAMYMKNQQLVFAHNCGGTINYLKINLDGQDADWVQGTTQPTN